MASNNNMKRNRNNNRRRSGSNVNRAYDSTGPEVKIRGTVTQIYDKYQALARDAQTSGDRVRAESLLQHAEHYYRMIKSMQAQTAAQQPNQRQPNEEQKPKNEDANPVEAKAENNEEAPTDANNADKPAPRKRRRRPRAEQADQPAAASADDSVESKPKDTPKEEKAEIAAE